MTFVLIILCAVFAVALVLAIQSFRKEKVEAVMVMAVPQVVSGITNKGIRRWVNIDNPVIRNRAIIIVSACIGGTLAVVLGGNFILMAAVGALIPYVILKQIQFVYEQRYRADGKAAIQFLHGIISANGTIEEWMLEVQPRLSGPLKGQFQHGYENYLRGVPVTKFLESLVRNCPDSGLALIFSGILREHRGAGNLKVYVDGAIRDMQNQERFIRVIGQIRKSGSQMLMYVFTFPVIFYALFSESVNSTLDKHPSANIVVLIGLGGYALLVWWGMRITRTKF